MDEQAIEQKRAEEKGLQDNLKALESSVRDLEKQWSVPSSQWGWRSWTIAKQFELLGIMSKLKKQRANLVKAQKKISATLKSIQEMETSVSAVKSNVESAKSTYRSQWAQEECCKSQIEALSKVIDQLELWKRETWQGLREYRDEASNSQSANPRARHGYGDSQNETVQCTQRSSDAALRGRDLARLLVRDTHRLRIKFPCRWFRFSLRT